MKTFYELIKESKTARRHAGAYIESLVNNAEKMESVLNGDVQDNLKGAVIVTSAKIALDKRQDELDAITAATKAVGEYETSDESYRNQASEMLLKLMQTTWFEICDAWEMLNILYQEFNKRNPS